MKIIGGYPADVDISLSKVGFDPTDSLAGEQGILDSQLQVSVASLGLASASLQSLNRFHGSFTVADHLMWRAFFQGSSNGMEFGSVDRLPKSRQGTEHALSC
eukprot:3755007-Amphidinium_carterae.1